MSHTLLLHAVHQMRLAYLRGETHDILKSSSQQESILTFVTCCTFKVRLVLLTWQFDWHALCQVSQFRPSAVCCTIVAKSQHQAVAVCHCSITCYKLCIALHGKPETGICTCSMKVILLDLGQPSILDDTITFSLAKNGGPSRHTDTIIAVDNL